MDIKKRLLDLPNEIKQNKMAILKYEKNLNNLQETISRWELQQLTEIADAIDEKGKAIFSNETKRKAELEKRKQGSSEYSIWQDTVNELKYAIQEKNIEISALYDEQGNLRAICRLEGTANE